MIRTLGRRLASGVLAIGLMVGLLEAVGPLVVDPAVLILGDASQAADLTAARRLLGLDRPWYQRVARGMSALFHPTREDSFWFRTPVAQLVARRWRVTTQVLMFAVATSLCLGALVTAAAALYPPVGVVASSWTFLLVFPLFVSASFLAAFFASSLRDAGEAAALGGALLGLYGGLWYARVILEVLRDEAQSLYFWMEKVLGIRGPRSVRRRFRLCAFHALGVFELQMALLLTGGTVVVEYAFHIEGLGLLLLESARRSDLPVLRFLVAWASVCYLAVSLVVFGLRRRLDPRTG
jgi:peptide/nickel transport system permease protein